MCIAMDTLLATANPNSESVSTCKLDDAIKQKHNTKSTMTQDNILSEGHGLSRKQAAIRMCHNSFADTETCMNAYDMPTSSPGSLAT
jgi:hypothetical protein